MTLLMMVLSQAVAPVHTAAEDQQPIIVYGPRADKTGQALTDCIARHCPPKEEIDASLAHAETQFLAGDYAGSRRTLLNARSRNAKYAKLLPVDVSDLLRANGRLAALNGLADVAHINAIDTLDALKRGLPADDARILMERLSVGDSFARQTRFDAARMTYDTVARQAHAAGLKQVEGYARLRVAVLYGAMAGVDPDYKGRARTAIRRIEATTDPELAPFREAAAILEKQVVANGKGRDALRAAFDPRSAGRTDRAVLIYAPPIDMPLQAPNTSTVADTHGDTTPQWADMTFRVTPDGAVADIETARRSKALDDYWLDLIHRSIAKRLYQPLAVPGLRRIERYSIVYDVVEDVHSRIRTRSSIPRIEMTDLTVDPTAR